MDLSTVPQFKATFLLRGPAQPTTLQKCQYRKCQKTRSEIDFHKLDSVCRNSVRLCSSVYMLVRWWWAESSEGQVTEGGREGGRCCSIGGSSEAAPELPDSSVCVCVCVCFMQCLDPQHWYHTCQNTMIQVKILHWKSLAPFKTKMHNETRKRNDSLLIPEQEIQISKARVRQTWPFVKQITVLILHPSIQNSSNWQFITDLTRWLCYKVLVGCWNRWSSCVLNQIGRINVDISIFPFHVLTQLWSV